MARKIHPQGLSFVSSNADMIRNRTYLPRTGDRVSELRNRVVPQSDSSLTWRNRWMRERGTQDQATSAHAYRPWTLSSSSSWSRLFDTSAIMSMMCSKTSVGKIGLGALSKDGLILRAAVIIAGMQNVLKRLTMKVCKRTQTTCAGI